MAYTTINKSTDYFSTKIYTGNGSSQSFTGVGHQPDFTWIKRRGSAEGHSLFDSPRGVQKRLVTNDNGGEATISTSLTAFGSDGFTLGGNDTVNGSDNYVSWNWKANGASTTTNNDGATTSYISHNSTAQFSIIKYTGTGSATNIGHGLNGKPDCFITKALSASDWHMWNNSFSANDRIKINSTGAKSTNTSIFPTLPDTTKIYFGSGGDVNQSSINYICYAWKNVTGYSKFGSYTGNGNNANGTFVYTGFKPAFVIFKRTSGTGNWQLLDNKRLGYNPLNYTLYPNTTTSDQDEGDIHLYSNGFQLRGTGTDGNGNNSTYIYMAFAEEPLVANVGAGIPATAR